MGAENEEQIILMRQIVYIPTSKKLMLQFE